ncbi:VIPP1 [Auxenochlorella protothecoides x Auxenochlorella symbiontica]
MSARCHVFQPRASLAPHGKGTRLSLHRNFAGTRLPPLQHARAPRASPVAVQANLFGRVVRIVKSYTSALVGGLEDPEKILEQAVSDMQNDLIRLRQAAAEVTAAQKRLQNKRDMAAQTADEWYRRAELALSKGDEELAREALTRRKAHAATATQLEGQLAQQTKAVSTIMGNMKMLEGKLQEAKLKKDTLKARAQSAKSARQIQDMVAGLNTSSALGAFEKMEEKVMAMESEAEAATMLASPDDGLESKFQQLEAGNVEDDLSELRRSLGTSKPKQQLPPGRPVRDAIDFELDEMRRNRQY